MSYTHITLVQRNELAILLRAKVKKKDIAQLLNKNRTTIWRERTKKCREDKVYDARVAKKITKSNRIKANKRFRKINNDP
ncbi:MAG: helix-turn-helix domain-containing protein [Candidatus ainarchaeum sp.]|jgi:IS30 family transposase|nr:helix-turn-helix domain-containing protein [Candidatus ainarchaeum sp.]